MYIHQLRKILLQFCQFFRYVLTLAMHPEIKFITLFIVIKLHIYLRIKTMLLTTNKAVTGAELFTKKKRKEKIVFAFSQIFNVLK